VNNIQNFLTQVFNDLRARRLLPVAALLVAGLVAAPIVLSKGGEEPTTAPETATSQKQPQQPRGPEALAQVKLEDALKEGNGSSLSAFDASDPFAPPEKVLRAARDAAEGDTGLTTPPDTGGTVTPGTDTGGGTGTGGGEGGGTPEGGSGGGGGGGGTETTQFTYVLDVTFWNNGRKRRVKNLTKLDMLPNESAPLLIFMGVTDNAGSAVFLVDSTLRVAGEGSCKPNRNDCAFFYMGAGSEAEFTNDDNDSYRLLINEIKRVKVGDPTGTPASEDEGSASASKATQSALGEQPEPRRFSLPSLIDYVVESSDSNPSDKRR
jgi:hypothetical protein